VPLVLDVNVKGWSLQTIRLIVARDTRAQVFYARTIRINLAPFDRILHRSQLVVHSIARRVPTWLLIEWHFHEGALHALRVKEACRDWGWQHAAVLAACNVGLIASDLGGVLRQITLSTRFCAFGMRSTDDRRKERAPMTILCLLHAGLIELRSRVARVLVVYATCLLIFIVNFTDELCARRRR